MEPVKITICSDPSHIGVVRNAVEAFGQRQGFTREQSDEIGLAVGEAIANVIQHGYQGDTSQEIQITIVMVEGRDEDGRGIRLVIRDHGKQVDPECIKGRELDDVRPGGLGVHFMKTVMDAVDYRCLPEGGMELTMFKRVR